MGTRRKLNIVVDAEYEGGREIKEAEADIDALGATSDKSSFSLGDLAKKGAIVGAALGAAALAAQQAYETIGEGADLIAAEQKFGNLAGSIDTTADALLGKMREATKGMVDDATLIAAGTDIMNLGLAKTEGGVVRMSAAVGALNLDMGVLALTLANDSTARLDSLGLSLEDVTAKKKELIASGFIGDAFDEAVLISLEEKMTLLGDASETTAGQMAIVEAQAANLTAEFKIMAATTAGPYISSLSTAVTGQNKLNDGIDAGVITTKEWNQIINESESIAAGQAIAIEVVNRRIGEQTDVIDKANKEAADYLAYQIAISGGLEDTTTAVTGLTLAQIYGAAAQEDANEAAKQSIRITAQNAAATIEDAKAREAATDAMQEQRNAIEAVRDAQAAAEATLGDYFTQALNADDALISFNRSVQTSGGLTSTQADNLSDLEQEQSKIIGTINSLQGGTDGLGLSSDELNEKLGEQYELLGQVEGAMAPLAGVTTDVVGVSESFKVNQDAVNASLYAAADAAGASGTELALLGLATGELSAEQAEAALKSAALMAQIEGLGTAIAEGMDPQEALNRLESFQATLDATDFNVRLGIEVEESTEKASDKTRETFDDFADKAETATDDAKTFFNTFADSAITNFGDVGISIDDLGEDFFKATTEAGKLKDMIIDGIPNEKIVTIKIRTEGSIPEGLSGGGGTSATTTGVSQDIGH